ncbi:ATP-dependent Clp protease ATP-binding subunit [bacterium]|nr:ATP-dependent Clp protease ATP-binding subunit [candidate division CSSED10-310 bacterium]
MTHRSTLTNAATPLPTDSIFLEIGEDLTQWAQESDNPPYIGRQDHIRQVFDILSRRFAPNPLIIGETGVGKSALVEELARRLVRNEVPEWLCGHKIIKTSFQEIWGSVGYTPNPWPRYHSLLKRLFREAEQEPIILFFDEIHQLFYFPISRNRMKEAIARGRIKVIGATTSKEFRMYFEQDSAFSRRFQCVLLEPATPELTREILTGSLDWFSHYYGIDIEPALVPAVVNLSESYIFNRHQPVKALDLLEGACNLAMRENATRLTLPVMKRVISRITGIPDENVQEVRQRYLGLEETLNHRVIGQESAIRQVVSRVLVAKAQSDIRPERPDGIFLFAGPSGVGKTELAKSLAQVLTGNDKHFLKLNMGQFKDPFSINVLLGVKKVVNFSDEPPEPSVLTRFAREHPYGVLLLDEIEKVHPEVLHMFMSLFDDGSLTDNQNVHSSFSYVTVIMTSNLGFSHEKGHIVMAPPDIAAQSRVNLSRRDVTKAIEEFFPREFLNRIDEVAIFSPLTIENLMEIVGQKVNNLAERLQKQLMVQDDVARFLAEQAMGTGLGARALNKIIDRHIGQRIARTRLSEEWSEITGLQFFLDGDNIEVIKLHAGS